MVCKSHFVNLQSPQFYENLSTIQFNYADSLLWRAARPLVDVVLRMEGEEGGEDSEDGWHGWTSRQIGSFLDTLPARCCLVVGVWETVAEGGTELEREALTLGVVCEVVEGEVRSLRTFDTLVAAGLKATEQLEPGFEDALEIMRVARMTVAPVAWALFTDKATWDEWIFDGGDGDDGGSINKSELLVSFVRRGRCVLMGSQAAVQQ